jgi:DNA-binding MarR family transcriptional regulator
MTQLTDDSLRLENQLCFSLYAASRKVIQLYAPMLDALGLTYTQYITLLVLWEFPSLPVKDLGKSLQLDTGTLTPVLKKLEKKGLVTRTRSTQDERSVLIELTSRGSEMKADALRYLPSLSCARTLDSGEMIDLRERVKTLLVLLQECD